MEEPQTRWEKVLEIVEVSVLAIVAIATAYSGYQGTQWGGEQARLMDSRRRHASRPSRSLDAGRAELVTDSGFFTAWLQAHAAGDAKLESMIAARFTPEYADAFQAWLATDPFTNPKRLRAPPSCPATKPLDDEGRTAEQTRRPLYFAAGTTARETANKFVRQTVCSRSVLFLVAIAQRFRLRGVRIAANALAFALLSTRSTGSNGCRGSESRLARREGVEPPTF